MLTPLDPEELQALADNLRDMMASDQLDPRLVRQAANALEAEARRRVVIFAGDEPFVSFLDAAVLPAPIKGPDA